MEFICKALTPQGQVVRSKVEEASRLACIRKLRKNGLTPITVTPVSKLFSKKSTSKTTTKNTKSSNAKKALNNARNNVRIKEKSKDLRAKGGIWEALNSNIGGGGPKIKPRDIRIFTQNFYLLKKANFNNIHALSTVIGTTENPRLRMILEDILAGVESGEYMYTTMEYYSADFPYIYINMIKVGEQIGRAHV